MKVILLGRIWSRKGLALSYMKVPVSFQFPLFPMHEHEYCSRISTTKTRRTANGDPAVCTFTATLPSSSSTLKHFYLSPPLAFLSLFSAIYFFQHMLFICLWISYFLYHRHGIIWYQIPSYFQEMGLASIFYTSTLH